MEEALALRRPQKTPTIGLLVAMLGDRYATAVVSGVADVVRAAKMNLVVFAGNTLATTNKFDAQGNVLYDLVSPERVDGLVILSGTMLNVIGLEKFQEFCRRYEPIPMVSIAVEVPGVPSVLVETESGMREALEHLITVHKHRKIAFIKGPDSNEEAARRFRVYQEVLRAQGIEYDPELVAPGTFNAPAGEEAVSLLLDHRMVDFSALAAANDTMAVSAIEAMQARGIAVPADVAVVGYDDIDEAKFVNPPLSTVRQPLYRQGRVAAEMLLARLRGEPAEHQAVMSTQFIVRQSCGCRYVSPGRSRSAGLAAERSLDSILRTSQAEVLEAMVKPVEASAPPELVAMVDRLLSAFISDVADARADAAPSSAPTTAALLDEILRRAAEEGDVSVWQEVISAMRRELLPALHDPRERSRADELWQQARAQISDAAQRAQARQRILAEKRARTLSSINQALIQTIDVAEVAEVVGRGLPLLHVRGCYLALYDGEGTPAEYSRLILSYDERNRVRAQSGGVRFLSRLLVPEGLLPNDRSWNMVVEPLFFRKEQLGFVLFEVDIHPHEGSFYEELREQLSSALKRCRREQELNRLREQERERARELEIALTALRDNQEKLLHSERMASLGRLTAGVAHEMNTPLAAVRMAIAELHKLVDEYRTSVRDPEITPEDHVDIAQEMTRALELAERGSSRAASFVTGIKLQTRDLESADLRSFDAVALARDTLLLLNHSIRHSRCEVRFVPAQETLDMHGSPGRLAQVLTNLLTNAIDAYKGKGGGTVDLTLRRIDSGYVELGVADRAGGIAAEILPKIFDPMFTTKPFGEGTGLGLAIVRDIVKGDFRGTIDVRSVEGEGAEFRCLLSAPEVAPK